MSVNTIIQALNNMTSLHQQMNVLARQKTEVIKKGNVDDLRTLLKEENKQIQSIKKLESTLLNGTELFLQENGIEEESPRLATVIQIAIDTDKDLLLKAKAELENEITELSKYNRLNQDLLEQSLQFVNMSLDLMQPDIESYNYDPNESSQHEHQKQTRSLFDSKA